MAVQHRLPTPGSDNGTWGDILNDFLVQAHNTDGSLQDGIITDVKVASSAAIAKTKLAPGVQTSLTAADNATPKPVAGTDGKPLKWNNTSGQLEDASATLNGTYTAKANLMVNIRDYGAKGDARSFTDATITSGQNILQSATAAFQPSDVGKVAIVYFAAGSALVTTVQAYTDSSHVTLVANATTTLSAPGVFAVIGSDDSAAFTAAYTTSGSVYLPAGFYINKTAFTIPAKGALIGAGSATQLVTKTISLQSHCRVRDVTFVSDGTPNSTALINVNTTAQVDVEIDNCQFNTWTFGISIDRTADNTQTEGWRITRNEFTNSSSSSLYAVRLFRSLISRNRSVSNVNGCQHILLTAGSSNRITDNVLTYGRTGINFVFRRDLNGSLGPTFGNVISGNIIKDMSEESISFDVNASTGTTVAVVDRDTVASKANPSGTVYTVTMTNAGWSSAGAAYLNWYAAFTTGSLKGQVVQITAQSNGLLTLALTTAQYALLNTGDTLIVCMPFLRNVVSGNTIDSSARCTTKSIYLYGLCYGNTVIGNTVIGTGTAGGISVQSLTDLAKPTNYTATFGLAPSEGNTVTGNTVTGDNLSIDLLSYGGSSYLASRNICTGNTVFNGLVHWESQTDATGLGINNYDGGTTPADSLNLLTAGQETMPRLAVQANAVTLTSTNMRLAYFTSRKTETVNNVRLVNNGAAGATPSLIRVGVYSVASDGTLTIIGSTTNDTTLFASPGAPYTKALSAGVSLVVGKRYAIGLLVVSSATMPTMFGSPNIGGVGSEANQAPVMSAAVNGQSDLPSPISPGSIGASAQMFYAAILP
jgi:predicted RNA-binding protein with TRAM domain